MDSLHYGSFKHIRKDCSGIHTANSHASGSQDDGYKTVIVETPPRKATHLMVEPSGTWACRRLLQTTQRSDLQLVSHRFYNAPKLARRFRGIVARCRKMSQDVASPCQKHSLLFFACPFAPSSSSDEVSMRQCVLSTTQLLIRWNMKLTIAGMMMSLGCSQSSIKTQARGSDTIHVKSKVKKDDQPL